MRSLSRDGVYITDLTNGACSYDLVEWSRGVGLLSRVFRLAYRIRACPWSLAGRSRTALYIIWHTNTSTSTCRQVMARTLCNRA